MPEKKVIKNLPKHVAIIMDGNGRWAKKRFLPRKLGHRAGAEAVRKAVEYAVEVGLECLTLYAFSSENWKRPKDEVDSLMRLLLDFLHKELSNLLEKNIILKIIGDLSGFPEDLREKLAEAQNKTIENNGTTLCIALGYGGQDEILTAVNNLIESGVKKITKENLESSLYTFGLPPLDLLIRTSGEQRISNFLLWQVAYSEFWFTSVLWPDFDKKEFEKALIDFGKRQRRYGDVE